MNQAQPNCYFIATSWNDAPVSQHFRALADALAARGQRVVLLVDGQNHAVENPQGNPAVYTWPSRRPVKWRDAWFLRRLIRQYRPACLIANYGASNLMMLAGWWLAVPCRVVWYHTVTAAIDLDAPAGGWRKQLLRWRKRLVYAAATHLTPASRAGRADVMRVFGIAAGKCRVFYNSLADPLAGATAAAAPEPNKVVCIGRLFPTKGQDVLLRALALLKERVPQLRAEFVGAGPDDAALRALAERLGVAPLCQFVGAVGHAQVLAHIQSAAVTVVPSRSDNNPLVVIEALALGVPVVASAVGGIVESLTDGVEGFLVPPEDPAALADKLYCLLTDDQLRQTLSVQARARFLAQFEQRGLIAEQAQWFEQLVAEQSAQRQFAVHWPQTSPPARKEKTPG